MNPLHSSSEHPPSTSSKKKPIVAWESFWTKSATRSEIFFAIYCLGILIGIVVGTINDPYWMRHENAIFVMYGVSITQICIAKYIAIKIMIAWNEPDGNN